MWCDKDCFNCTFDDCIAHLNDITNEDRLEQDRRDARIALCNMPNDEMEKAIKAEKARHRRKEYMREYMRDYNHNKLRGQKRKVIRIGDTVVLFDSVKEAAESVGGYSPPIVECCRGRKPQMYGYKWRYAE